MKNDMRKIVKTLCKEYYVDVPEPIKNYIVSTAIPEERTHLNSILLSDRKEVENSINNNGVENTVIMQKSLPLNAMKMKEINMPKSWEVPELPY